MSLGERIEFMRNGLNVRRYHQHATLEIDTVGKHSCGVALFVNLIDPGARKEVLVAAISHDLGEWVLGDIPAPTKRALPPDSRALLDKVEDNALIAHGYEHNLSDSEYLLLKLADYCDGLRFTIEERRRGNQTLHAVATAYCSYLNELMTRVPAGVVWWASASDVIKTLFKQKEQAYVR